MRSITVDGVSLTANVTEGLGFSLLINSDSWKVASPGQAFKGLKVNLELDPLARYAARA